MSEQNSEVGERRRRREEERRRLAGAAVAPAQPVAPAPAQPQLSRRELREREAAQSGATPVAAPSAAPQPARTPTAQPTPRPMRPTPRPAPQPTPTPTPEPQQSRRDLRERAAALRQQAEAGRQTEAAPPTAPAAVAGRSPQAPSATPVVQATPAKSASPAWQPPSASSPLSPQARAAAIRAQAARAQAEREDAARVQVERAQNQRAAQQRPAAQPAPGMWTQRPTGAQETGSAASVAQRPAPAAPSEQTPMLRPSGPDTTRPGQSAPVATPDHRGQEAAHDGTSSVRRVILPPMEPEHEPTVVPRLQQGAITAPGQSTGWAPAQVSAPVQAPAPASAPAATPTAVPGITPSGAYQPVISPARPGPARPGATGVGGPNGATAAPVTRQPACAPVEPTPDAVRQPGVPAGQDRDAAATVVGTFPRVAPAGPAFAPVSGAAAPAIFPATRSVESPTATPDSDLPQWGSFGWTPAPAAGAVIDADADAPHGFGSATGFGTGVRTGFGSAGAEFGADTAERSAAARPEPEVADEPDDEAAHHPYTWLHMIVLVAVAFILGMLIFMVVMQDDGADAALAGADGTYAQQVVVDGGAGA